MQKLRQMFRWLRYFGQMLVRAPGVWNRWNVLCCIGRMVAAQAGWHGKPRQYHLRLDGAVFNVIAERRDLTPYAPIWIDGEYEPEGFVPRVGQTVVDVGAQVGFYTIRAAWAVGPTGRVFSLEPDPVTFLLLEANIRDNGLQNVRAINAACGAVDGPVFFDAQPHSVNSRILTHSA